MESHSPGTSHSHDVRPFTRLLDLLRPERGDIAVVLVFSIVIALLSLATPITVEAMVNNVAFGRYLQPLVVLAIMLFSFLAFAGLLRGLQSYVVEVIQQRLFVRVVARLAHLLPRVKVDVYRGHHGPELLNRFFEVVTVQKSAASLILDGLTVVITAVVGMAVLALYHPFLLGFDLVLMASIAFIVFILGHGAVKTAINESYKKYAVASWLEQLAHFPITFKREGGFQQAVLEADRLSLEYVTARKKHFRILMRQIIFTLLLQVVAGTALLGIGGFLVINGQLTLGQLVASELIVAVIASAVAKLGKHMESYYDLLAAVDKLGHVFDLPVEREGGVTPPRTEAAASVHLVHVAFDFGPHQQGFAPLTLEIAPGERIAIDGPPGSGKSRLLESLYLLNDPASGHIEFDGIDLRSIKPSELRSQIALVRGVDVFEGTIAENIQMDRDHVRHADMRRALEAVGLWGEIMRLPQGLETKLVPGGAPLGDSQVIRLSLARALAGSPRLLLIDSILDQLSDDLLPKVFEAIGSEQYRPTVIVVSGREMLRVQCDKVVYLGPEDPDGRPGSTKLSGANPAGTRLKLRGI